MYLFQIKSQFVVTFRTPVIHTLPINRLIQILVEPCKFTAIAYLVKPVEPVSRWWQPARDLGAMFLFHHHCCNQGPQVATSFLYTKRGTIYTNSSKSYWKASWQFALSWSNPDCKNFPDPDRSRTQPCDFHNRMAACTAGSLSGTCYPSSSKKSFQYTHNQTCKGIPSLPTPQMSSNGLNLFYFIFGI